MPVFIIGHVTKSGDIALRVLEHIVDVVLYRRATPIAPCGCCAGTKTGTAPSTRWACSRCGMRGCGRCPAQRLFMGERILTADVSSAPTVTVQGSRPFMLEVQALRVERAAAEQGAPFDAGGENRLRQARRLQLLLAVLGKFCLGSRLTSTTPS